MMNDLNHNKPESSSEKINYLVRPAKQIERKLIIEALQCLNKKYPINAYEYIGMGSLFYVDYQMFHKYLSIKLMKSMEKEKDKIDRYSFNKPYDFITLIPGTSTEILPTLEWGKNMFIWLDYDSKVSQNVINDIQILSNYINAGGIFLITLDAEPKRFDPNQIEGKYFSVKERLKKFQEELYPYYPSDMTEKDMSLKNFPLLLQKIIVSIIEEKLSLRKNLNYFQIFNLKYKDTSQMYTFGCVFEKISDRLESSGVFDLEFISTDSTMIEINVPIITPLERIHFDKLIPDIANKLTDFEMDEIKLRDYEKYYKYYPQYFEALL